MNRFKQVDVASTASGMPAARQLARVLKQQRRMLVLTESCTGGLIASWLTTIPGISEHFCGSAVVYRNATKSSWLDVPPEKLIRPGPVSKIVAEAMARGVLEMTPEADLAASITGHFGPNAPAHQDGLFFVGIAERFSSAPTKKVDDRNKPHLRVVVHRFRFPTASAEKHPQAVRRDRQRIAGRIVCQLLINNLARS
ncbi:MAG: CinA family protein [Planctomycetaceae bacterium]